jgi:hypothetical protein
VPYLRKLYFSKAHCTYILPILSKCLFETTKLQINNFLDSTRYANKTKFKEEIAVWSKLLGYCKEIPDFEGSNGAYFSIKELETKRLEYLC